MTISNIQKEKFLNTLYKNLYSSGNKPKEQEILDFFSRYFSKYEPGQPLDINAQVFRQLAFGNVEIFNQKTLHTLFNIETLYDSIFENSDDMLTVATALNKRLENLKAKRIALENKVDNLIFANQNSEGYFSAYSDSFSNVSGTDLNYTSAFVDTVNGKVSLPTLKSSVFDLISTSSVVSSAPTYSVSFNRTQIETNKQFSEDSFFGSVFDGLENTEWQKIFYFDSVGLVSFSINLPISKNVVLSRIEGRLNTISPTDIYIKINYVDQNKNSEVMNKKSTKDYDRFSFSFDPGNVGSIDLYLVKTEPDVIEDSRVNKYGYRYGIRDISISGQYYDKTASYVSSAISLNTKDNSNLVIDSVALDAAESIVQGGVINYFVAEDNLSAQSISDFSWIPIAPESSLQNSFPTSVNFSGSTLKSLKILEDIEGVTNAIKKIPAAAKTSSINLNTQNPIVDLYPNQNIYRIAALEKLENPVSAYILEGINSISGSYINYKNSIYNEREELSTWGNILTGKSSVRQVFTIPSYEITNNSIFFTGPNLNGISVLLDAKIFCATDITVRHLFVKNDAVSKDWDVAIYLNGRVTAIPAGTTSDMVEWNFKAGINTIKVAIDIEGSANGSINLMDSKSLLDYGLVHSQYYGYVDPLEFKNNRSKYDKVFTIENFFGNKEIFCRDNIRSNSRIFFYSNNPDPVTAIRFRADIARGSNPLASPTIDYFKIKFKNSQKYSDISVSELSSSNSSTSDI
jgi:hypothetical protein